MKDTIAYEFENYIGIKDYPLLMLYTNHSKWKEDYKPMRIQHQSGGLACFQREFFGLVLSPTPLCEYLFEHLISIYSGRSLGAFPKCLNQITDYRDILRLHGLDCNISFEALEESVYPIDLTDESLQLLTSDKFCGDLDDLLSYPHDDSIEEALQKLKTHWGLVILTHNSD